MNLNRVIEICADSVQSCIEAELGGAQRVELCAALSEGGITPSLGEIRLAKELTSKIDINVLIRPRGGDFLYTSTEVKTILYDVEVIKECGIHGVVIGCLTKEGDVDFSLLKEFVEAAQPLSVTFHRAFDVCRDPFIALEKIIDAGCDRILTSGQQANAVLGIPLLSDLVKQADGRVIVMPGGGVRPDNIVRIQEETGAKEFHTSARKIVQSKMEYRNERVSMGGCTAFSEYEIGQTDRELVRLYL